MTSLACKTMESLLNLSLMKHLEDNHLLSPAQHGFRAGRSTTICLLEFLEVVTRLVDEGKSVTGIWTDFVKCFDKIPKSRLGLKLKSMGITGKIAAWVMAWLMGRRQRVVINGHSSGWEDVISSCVQGSRLGPNLALIYLTDIDEAFTPTPAPTHQTVSGAASHQSPVAVVTGVGDQSPAVTGIHRMFADDCKKAENVSNEEERIQFQAMLDRLAAWSEAWQMPFNIDKCHLLHFHRNNPKFDFTLCGQKLKAVHVEKDLGVLIEASLKPTAQVLKVAAKAKGVLTQLTRGVTYRDKITFVQLYKCYVLPTLQYTMPAWRPWTEGDIGKLETVQQKFVSQVSGLCSRDYVERARECGLRTVRDSMDRGDMIALYRIV